MKYWLYILSDNTRGYCCVKVNRRGMFFVNPYWNIKYKIGEKHVRTLKIRTFDNRKVVKRIEIGKNKFVEHMTGRMIIIDSES